MQPVCVLVCTCTLSTQIHLYICLCLCIHSTRIHTFAWMCILVSSFSGVFSGSQPCGVVVCLSSHGENIRPHHLCLGNCACLPDTCLYVLYVLWIAIRVVHTGYSLPAHAMPDGHPSFSLMSWGLLKSLALATNQQPHCTVYISSCLHASNSHVAI